jgi:hypothetical protein
MLVTTKLKSGLIFETNSKTKINIYIFEKLDPKFDFLIAFKCEPKSRFLKIYIGKKRLELVDELGVTKS